ncbi:MAG TPA: hypothetical protein VMU83_01825 [Hanamia sp.]|nr:hypothetical protein [Hanamia sp.]
MLCYRLMHHESRTGECFQTFERSLLWFQQAGCDRNRKQTLPASRHVNKDDFHSAVRDACLPRPERFSLPRGKPLTSLSYCKITWLRGNLYLTPGPSPK